MCTWNYSPSYVQITRASQITFVGLNGISRRDARSLWMDGRWKRWKNCEATPCKSAHKIQAAYVRAYIRLPTRSIDPRRYSAPESKRVPTSKAALTTRNAQVLGFLSSSGRGMECIGGAVPTQRDTRRSSIERKDGREKSGDHFRNFARDSSWRRGSFEFDIGTSRSGNQKSKI